MGGYRITGRVASYDLLEGGVPNNVDVHAAGDAITPLPADRRVVSECDAD